MSTLKRLLILSRASDPHGGVESIIADLCRELPAYGWDVVLGLTQGAKFNDVARYRDVYPDLPIDTLDGRIGTRGSRRNAIRVAIRKHRPDVVLALRVFDAFEAIAMEKTPNGPRFAVGIRSFEPAYLADLRKCGNVVDLCVTSGELIAAACKKMAGMDSKRVVSIGGGVRPPHSTPRPRHLDSHVRLLYAGRLEQDQKRILDLAALAEELVRRGVAFELDVVGTGNRESELRTRLASLVADKRVRIHGWVSNAELYERFYPAADCFVHFAAWEGMTIAPREAMAHGVIPIVSQFTGLACERIFVDGQTALTFPVGEIAAAADCVERLLADRSLAERLSSNAIRCQAGVYGFAGAIRAWSDALERCLGLPARCGEVPTLPEQIDGRLTRYGIPASWQAWVRERLKLPLRHGSPGSEWPTSSGQLSSEEVQALHDFARRMEEGIVTSDGQAQENDGVLPGEKELNESTESLRHVRTAPHV